MQTLIRFLLRVRARPWRHRARALLLKLMQCALGQVEGAPYGLTPGKLLRKEERRRAGEEEQEKYFCSELVSVRQRACAQACAPPTHTRTHLRLRAPAGA